MLSAVLSFVCVFLYILFKNLGSQYGHEQSLSSLVLEPLFGAVCFTPVIMASVKFLGY